MEATRIEVVSSLEAALQAYAKRLIVVDFHTWTADPGARPVYGLFNASDWLLNSPITDAVERAGGVLLEHLTNPLARERRDYQEALGMILGPGGLVKFDRQQKPDWNEELHGANHLEELSSYLPHYAHTSEISVEAWENFALGHNSDAIPSALSALNLDDGNRLIGLTHEDVRFMLPRLQTWQIAKTSGLETARKCIDYLLQDGYVDGTDVVAASL